MTANREVEEPLISDDPESASSVVYPAVSVHRSNGNSRHNQLSNIVKAGFLLVSTVSVVYLLVVTTDTHSADKGLGQLEQITDDGSIIHPHEFHIPKDESYKYILMFSDFYDDDRNWYLGTNTVRDSYFADLKCPETKCVVTSNRTFLHGGVPEFDALLFFAHNKGDLKEYPRFRRPEQVYVISMLETPPHTWRTFERDWDYFNWTMTFRFDSDVFWSYGYFADKQTENVITPSHHPIWRQLEDDHYDRPFFHNETILDLIRKKTKTAAWFVSNCQLTPSQRMDVATNMQQFIDVDIYGKCGNKSCPKNEHSSCQQMLERDYKFYLSFENSLCKDYLTEKVFSNMNYFIIPVLYNAAENHKFLPPGSYLNVLDYSSIKELTDHMQFLSDHPEEYIKYFWWKEFYYVRSGYNFCDLCVKMHEEQLVERRQYYRDLDAWYRDGACIKTPVIPLQ